MTRLPVLVLALLLTLGVTPGPPVAASAVVPDLRHAGTPTPSSGRVTAATECPARGELRAARGVVLLVAGTGSTPEESWSWSYEPALRADGFATCTVRLPEDGLGSFTLAAGHVVAAIRAVSRLADARIAVVGHSQGGALPVWAVKFWPGVARRVTDVVSLAGPFTGTRLGNELCTTGQCAPLAWQLRRGARTVAALQDAPLPRRVAVTSISSLYDEIVRPQPAASHLAGASNVVLQDVCLQDPSEHGIILGDPVAYALVRDALTHRGPASPARLPAAVCEGTFIPHGDPAGAPLFLQSVARFAAGLADPTRWVDHEPRLPPYARPWAG